MLRYPNSTEQPAPQSMSFIETRTRIPLYSRRLLASSLKKLSEGLHPSKINEISTIHDVFPEFVLVPSIGDVSFYMINYLDR